MHGRGEDGSGLPSSGIIKTVPERIRQDDSGLQEKQRLTTDTHLDRCHDHGHTT